MKILITGALGHIGSKLIRSLDIKRTEEVILMDDLSRQRYCSLFNLPKSSKFRFVEEDICKSDLDKRFSGIDIVIHLAAITNAVGSFENKAVVNKVNYSGTKRVALACVKNKCKLIFISTTSVYNPQNGQAREDLPVSLADPQSPYAYSKLRAENLLRRMGKDLGLRFVICRFGTIYGFSTGMSFHTAVNKFIWQACINRPITVWKTALRQKRPYLYLDNAVSAINFIVMKNIFNNQTFNIVSDNFSVEQILNAIRDLKPKIKIGFIDSPVMNQLSYEAKNDEFSSLGFNFRGNLKKGIKETINALAEIYG